MRCVHCVTERQARQVLAALADRMVEVGLRLHPDKTRIVYCKDGNRRGSYEHTSFTFLGYTFRAREGRRRNGQRSPRSCPAISKDALKKIERGGAVLAAAPPHRICTFAELARRINPIVAGWMQLLRRVLPLGAVSPPDAHQRLPGALDPQEVQTARGRAEGHREAAGDHPAIPRMFAHWG